MSINDSGVAGTSGHILDHPVRASLLGRHRVFARRCGGAIAYLPELASFASLPQDPTPRDWHDLGHLVGPGNLADLFSAPGAPPDSWSPVFWIEGLQLVGNPVSAPTSSDSLVELGLDDVPEMTALVAHTKPGPFGPRTVELGRYLGIRRNGRLVAMAGERLRPTGWTEISAVCTDPEWRGRGFARDLVLGLSASITAAGDRPFLHVVESNVAALRLYEQLGFTMRRSVIFRGFRIPE